MSLSAPFKLKLIVAYDGGPFSGWQSQRGGNTVQDHLESAFAKICGSRIVVHGAGRTDAGVHALGQCAHVVISSGRLPPERFAGAINACLPPQIRVVRCVRAAPGFHARFSAKGKIYVYRIWNGAFLPPMEFGRAWFVPGPLDWDLLEQAASRLTGKHDFAGFAANRGKPGENTVRTVSRITAKKSGRLVTLRFCGDGFLYKMVRLMTGTIVRCALEKAPLEWIGELLAAKGAQKTNFAAPAGGLYLHRVIY